MQTLLQSSLKEIENTTQRLKNIQQITRDSEAKSQEAVSQLNDLSKKTKEAIQATDTLIDHLESIEKSTSNMETFLNLTKNVSLKIILILIMGFGFLIINLFHGTTVTRDNLNKMIQIERQNQGETYKQIQNSITQAKEVLIQAQEQVSTEQIRAEHYKKEYQQMVNTVEKIHTFNRYAHLFRSCVVRVSGFTEGGICIHLNGRDIPLERTNDKELENENKR